jgi:hypothetical protein
VNPAAAGSVVVVVFRFVSVGAGPGGPCTTAVPFDAETGATLVKSTALPRPPFAAAFQVGTLIGKEVNVTIFDAWVRRFADTVYVNPVGFRDGSSVGINQTPLTPGDCDRYPFASRLTVIADGHAVAGSGCADGIFTQFGEGVNVTVPTNGLASGSRSASAPSASKLISRPTTFPAATGGSVAMRGSP